MATNGALHAPIYVAALGNVIVAERQVAPGASDGGDLSRIA
jgi:hypothetical protein